MGRNVGSNQDAIVQGKHLTTLALSESGTGAHFYYPQTKLIQNADRSYRIDGQKTFVTNGGFADSYVVPTVAADSATHPNHFSCVIIPHDTEGVRWGPPWEGLGLRGNSSRAMEIENVTIPETHLLGREGDQIWYVFNVVAPYFLMAMSGAYLGVAAAAFEEARNHLKQRRYTHNGASLAQSPILQHRLGSVWGVMESTRQMVHRAALAAEYEESDALPALCISKAQVAECAVTLVNECMTLCGGIAYRNNSVFDRLLRDARAAHVMAPTTDILRIWAGRALLDEPILSD